MKITILKILIPIVVLITLLSTTMVTIYTPNSPLSISTHDTVATQDEVTKDEVTTHVIVTTQGTSTIKTQPTTTEIINKLKVEATTVAQTVNQEQETTFEPISEPIEENIDIEEKTENEPTETSKDNDSENDTENNNIEYLLDIDNPDETYIPQRIYLTDSEREGIARIVMGEFGGGGFTGCALIAQAIRDAIDSYGISPMNVRSQMQYYGYNTNPNQNSYDAVDWIFDGNAAVQHRIIVMNNSSGGWHGTQNFVVYYQGVWFYDLWW